VARFVVRRFVFAVVLVFVVASAAFVLTRLAPGDYFTDFGPGAERRAQAGRAAAGFDRPLIVQYGAWLGRAVRLDLGSSLKFQAPVRDLVWPRTLNTAVLGVVALCLATVWGIPLGVFTATGTAGMLRRAVRVASSILLASPSIVIVLGALAAASRAAWLPPPGAHMANLIVPALALALPAAAVIERTHSQALQRVLAEPYLLAAAARGVPRRVLLWKHAMRGALNETLSSYSVIAGALLSGSFVVEIVADWPGLGQLTADALRARDPFLLCGCSAAAALILASVMLISDLLHFWIDPRLRQP
jgi:ABC-type dipeptide/oligopeptide/nickel transport system permease component